MERICNSRNADAAIAALAARQSGVVSRAQALAAGLGAGAIRHRLRCGRLHRIHPGAYAVGHDRLSIEGRWMAAVLSCGAGTVLSHRSAASLHGLLRHGDGQVEVISPHQLRARAGVCIHRCELSATEVMVDAPIPVTTAARTLFDLAAMVPRHRLEYAVNQAEYRGLSGALSLPELLRRHPGARGTATLRSVLAAGGLGESVTRSELEDRFLEFVRDHGLPPPRVNAVLRLGSRSIEADCLWTEQRLIAELDGRAAHHGERAFERDRVRDRRLLVAGWQTIRVTWHELHRHPARLATDLWALLARPTAAASAGDQRAFSNTSR